MINFDDVKNNRQLTVNGMSNGLVKKLYDDIKTLFNEGLPIYFIDSVTNSICESLEDEKKLLKK